MNLEKEMEILFYTVPEWFSNGNSFDTLKADIHAIWITVYAITELNLFFSFAEDDADLITYQIIKGDFNLDEYMDELFVSFFNKCTNIDPEQCPGINEIF